MEPPIIASSASPISVMRFNTTRRPLSLMPLPDTLLDTLEASEPGLSIDQARDVEEEYVLVASTDTTTKLEQQVYELTEENTRMAERIRSLEGLVMQAKLKVREAFQALDCSICLTTIKWPVSTCECQHYFCDSCLKQWLQWQKEKKIPETCPLCRNWLFEDPQKMAVRPLRDMVEILQGIRLLAPEGSGIDLATVLTAHEGHQLP
ncbi:hypothetical protein PC9H_005790 [Pleurotus ostreatus]|uniref:RING-type domain-containing protein n=3 Tax=Pleurotus ostreatus TaxID=5322 RepID=A0A8H7DUP4_PLEOS|nr:uncharacterized protein PC9H_005790 [Pleurotus ostreatus]KAF7433824.1 hypothetical protein PC9H_005790 [Pleurotus ostreatus]KAJ8694197.1 RING finger protein 39 [Pleurotus ostreatus]KAJ8697377.1 RING finger protein 39 [Pleurotus ostreatus]